MKHLSEEHKRKLSLSKMGEKNPFFGRGPNKGKQLTKEHKEKLRLAKLKNPVRYWLGKSKPDFQGERNPMKREDVKRKVSKKNRLTLTQRFIETGISARYNPIACQKIDEYGKQQGYKFQHALNGGEFYVKELGYWVDGYDKKHNVVIEYYEKKHRYYKKRDAQRKKEIVECLGCRFIEIKEWENTNGGI